MRSLFILVVSIAVIYAETTAHTTGVHKAVGSVKPYGTGKPPGKPFIANQLTKEEELSHIEAKITNFFANLFKGYRHIKPAQKPSVAPHGVAKKDSVKPAVRPASAKPPVQPAPVKPAVLPAKV